MQLKNFTPADVVTHATGVLESKPFRLGSIDGFFLYPKRSIVFSQLFEPCLSCGRRLRLTAGTITVRGRCGHIGVCRVCRGCVQTRGLIG